MRPFLQNAAVFVAGVSAALAATAFAQVTAFPDVPQGAFYAASTGRMVARGIVRGYDSGRFGPLDPVSRGQFVVLLDRYDKEVVEPLQVQVALMRSALKLGACGDGTAQAGEECDDGNRIAGDGCGEWCQEETAFRPRTASRCPTGVGTGDRFQAADGCNTCVCTQDGPSCTEMACTGNGGGDLCLDDADCGEGGVCSTRYGDCRSSCEEGAEVCVQVCAGFCSPDTRVCRPYVCADGSVHPACTPDGDEINYFADPCLGKNPRCGDGVCETLERDDCDARDPRCFSCVYDCGEEQGLSCVERQGAFDALATASRRCAADADCTVFQQSCPFVTCGVAIRRDAQEELRAEADAQIAACQSEGEPLACAMCIAQTAVCERGLCTLKQAENPVSQGNLQRRCAVFTRDGTETEQCAVCGDGTCTSYEHCTASHCSGMTCTRDCGGLHCPQDCA